MIKYTILLISIIGIYIISFNSVMIPLEASPFIKDTKHIDIFHTEIISSLQALHDKKKAEAREKYLKRIREEERIRKEKIRRDNLAYQRVAKILNEIEQKRIRKEEKIELARIKKEKQLKDNSIIARIDLSEQRMRVYKGDNLIYKWKVSTARKGYRTPKGSFKPQYMQKMHYSREYNNSPMPYSIFFRHGGYAIHGTKSVNRLGTVASHGCVRLHTNNAKKLFALVKKSGKKNTIIHITN